METRRRIKVIGKGDKHQVRVSVTYNKGDFGRRRGYECEVQAEEISVTQGVTFVTVHIDGTGRGFAYVWLEDAARYSAKVFERHCAAAGTLEAVQAAIARVEAHVDSLIAKEAQ